MQARLKTSTPLEAHGCDAVSGRRLHIRGRCKTMSKLRSPGNRALSSACVLFLSACSYGPRLETTVITLPGRQLAIYGVRSYAHEKGLLVTGRVRRQAPLSRPIWGHLHVQGLFEDRRPPVTVDTRWGTLSPRGNKSATFTALLRTPTPLEIKSVTVEYRAAPDQQKPVRLD